MVIFKHKFQIFNPVVKGVTIPMMHNFTWVKESFKMLLHNETMFHYMPLCASIRMIGNKNSPIILVGPVFYFSFKTWVLFTRHSFGLRFSGASFRTKFSFRRFFIKHLFSANFARCRYRVRFSPSCFEVTLVRTILCLISTIWMNTKLFFTYQAGFYCFYNHKLILSQ